MGSEADFPGTHHAAIKALEKENDEMRSLLDWRDHTMMAVEKDEFFRLRRIEEAARKVADEYHARRNIGGVVLLDDVFFILNRALESDRASDA